MADTDGKSAPKRRRRKKPKLTYFYVDGKLYRTLRIIRPQDIMYAWSYLDEKRVAFIYSDVRRRAGKAFTTADVCKMFGKHRVTVERYILRGVIDPPQMAYSLDGNKKPTKYLWSDKDIMALHEYLINVHIGRPRQDGLVIPGDYPTKAELRALISSDTVLYVKNEDGEFIPTWKEPEWW